MTIKDKKSTNWYWSWDLNVENSDSLFEIPNETTDFGLAIRTIRKAHKHGIEDMERVTGVHASLLAWLEAGTTTLPTDVVKKICVGYHLNQSDCYALKQAFEKTKEKEKQWQQKPESYFWYIEEHQRDTSNKPCLSVDGIGGGPFLDINQAISIAQRKIARRSSLYIFSLIEDYRPGSGIIAYKNIAIRYTETLVKFDGSGIILPRNDIMAAKQRFIERLKGAVEIRKKQQEQDQNWS